LSALDLVLLLPTLPLVSALSMLLLSRQWGRAVVRISTTAAAAAVAVAAVLMWLKLSGREGVVAIDGSWGSLLVDPLGLLMAAVIAVISFVVRVYSVRYMIEEPGYVRFFVLLDLMVAALFVMVLAGDLVTLLVAWHVIGIALYFLLGHDMRSVAAHRYGFWTFLTYRLGDLPLVLAAVLLHRAFDSWSLPTIFRLVREQPEMTTVGGLPLVEVVGLLVALAAFARSAQILLHTWLPYTMEGPTPVSVLMHAGIVNAGGFVINRFAPVFVYTDWVLHLVFVVGLVTALTGSVLMLTQNDVKKQLGYSTMGQMGFMTMQCGVGAFTLAIYHLIAHGLFKGTLFLGSGGVIKEARDHDGVPKDSMYTFVIEKQPQSPRYARIVMAMSTILVPLAVLGIVHVAVAPDVFEQQGAVVLLFFGWVTGAQLLLTAYRLPTRRPVHLVSVIVLSFTAVVVFYTLISHAFAEFLYPKGFQAQLYEAARIEASTLAVLIAVAAVVALAAVAVSGWAGLRDRNPERQSRANLQRQWRATGYGVLMRELYLAELYVASNRGLLAVSARLNTWLRWG